MSRYVKLEAEKAFYRAVDFMGEYGTAEQDLACLNLSRVYPHGSVTEF